MIYIVIEDTFIRQKKFYVVTNSKFFKSVLHVDTKVCIYIYVCVM
jgi:hypothetical protein